MGDYKLVEQGHSGLGIQDTANQEWIVHCNDELRYGAVRRAFDLWQYALGLRILIWHSNLEDTDESRVLSWLTGFGYAIQHVTIGPDGYRHYVLARKAFQFSGVD